MAAYKNIAIIGGSGALGTPILNALINSGKFNITALKRPTSSATFPSSVTVKAVDITSVDALTNVFKGQDAVLSTVGQEGLPGQETLIKAASAAGVKRFLPSDYGCDLENPKARSLPVFKYKVDTHEVLVQTAAANPSFTYTSVVNGAFLDWGLEKGFLLNWTEPKPKLYDDGNAKFSATTLPSIGQAVVGVLTHPEETKNRSVYVKDIDISQNQLLAIAKKVNPGKNWEEPEYVETAEIEKSSWASLQKGEITMMVMFGFLFRLIFGPAEYGRQYIKTDNELLGVKGKTEADIEALLKSY